MEIPITDPAVLALALEAVPGLGRVTAGRLLKYFSSYADLCRYPREQVLLRIKGAPKADALVAHLFDEARMVPLLNEARATLRELARRRISVRATGADGWPARLNDLPRALRPNVLYAYGQADLLYTPGVAFLARLPISSQAFECAQALTHHLMPRDLPIAAGMTNGFDLVLHKIYAASPAPRPSIIINGSGLARLDRPYRPMVSRAVRNGSVFASPFPLTHGPFEHDERERAFLMTGLTPTAVFIEPRPDTVEWQALTWALEAGRPVFALAHPDFPVPEHVHPLNDAVFDHVVRAAQTG